MKFFATALVAAAFEAQLALGVELGQSCVTAPLSKVFKRINLLRANAVDDTVTKPNYTTVVGSGTAFTAGKWVMLQNGVLTAGVGTTWDVTVLSGNARITTGVALIGKTAPTVKVPMVWSEGLALGNATYLNEWAAAYGKSGAFSGLSTPNGTTTASRAKENGSAGGPLVEAAYFFEAYSVDATDLMNFLITNDGSGNEMAAALFDSAALTYKAVSIGIKKADSCTIDITTAPTTPTGCQHAMLVTATTAYTNGGSVAVCQPVVSYGGGVCDPDVWGGSVWEQMQDARQFRGPVWKPLFDAMALKVDGMQVTWDWVGAGSETVETIVNTSAVSQTATASNHNDAKACDAVPWKWYPAMFLAAKDQTTYMATAADVSSTHGDSSLASRGAKYGAPGAEFVEGIYKGTNSAQMTVANLLLQGASATDAPFRIAFWTAANDQAGVSCATHTDKERVCTAVVGSGFVASDAYAACTVAAVAATAVTPAGAASLAGAMLVASASALALLQ